MLDYESYFAKNLSHNLTLYLAIHIIIILVLIILNFRHLVKQFKQIKKVSWALLFLILVLGLHLRLSPGIAFQPSSESDWEYNSIAKHLTKESKAAYFNHLYGYPFLLSYFFRLFGADIFSVFYFNVMIGALSILLIFLFSYALFKRTDIALISALILAILPRHIYFSRVGASENISFFFMVLTLTVLIISTKLNLIKMYFLAFALLSYSGEIKAESLAIIIVFFVYFLINYNKISILKLLMGFTLFIILSIPISYWLINYEGPKFMINKVTGIKVFRISESTQSTYSENSSSLSNNIDKLLKVASYTRDHNILLLISLFISLIAGIKYPKQFILLLSLLFVEIPIYSISAVIPSSERYIILYYPALVPLMSLGLFVIVDKIRKVLHIRKLLIVFPLVLILILTTFSPKELIDAKIKLISKYDYSRYNDIYDILRAGKELDKNATIVCCGYMKHCDFLMPNRKVVTIDDIDINAHISITKYEETYYFRSRNEKASGCKEEILSGFILENNLTLANLSNRYNYIKIFKIN